MCYKKWDLIWKPFVVPSKNKSAPARSPRPKAAFPTLLALKRFWPSRVKRPRPSTTPMSAPNTSSSDYSAKGKESLLACSNLSISILSGPGMKFSVNSIHNFLVAKKNPGPKRPVRLPAEAEEMATRKKSKLPRSKRLAATSLNLPERVSSIRSWVESKRSAGLSKSCAVAPKITRSSSVKPV